ncbi:MAG: hypothetical protein R2755_33615 [Acidimicrobiales bacterium]
MTDAPQSPDQPGELVYWWSPRGDDRVFDLAAWPDEAVATARALLEEDGLEHSWEGASLVVAKERRDDAAALLDEVVAAAAMKLDADADRTAYDLSDWPDDEVETLREALEGAGILFEWTDDGELLVYEVDEQRVDELFERLDLHGPNPGIELDGESLTFLLTNLFMAAGTLAEDADDADAVLEGHRSILELEQLAVPYGMNRDAWGVLVADAVELRRLIEAEAGEDKTAVRTGGGSSADRRPLDDGPEGDDVLEDEVDRLEQGALDDADGDDVVLFGDEAIMAVAARVRDRLKRLL